MGPKWVQNGSKMCQKLVKNGSKNGSKMGPKWVQNKSKMVSKMVQNGSKMGPKWIQNGRKWVQNGSKNGSKMGPKWVQNGSKMDPKIGPKWVQNGSKINLKLVQIGPQNKQSVFSRFCPTTNRARWERLLRCCSQAAGAFILARRCCAQAARVNTITAQLQRSCGRVTSSALLRLCRGRVKTSSGSAVAGRYRKRGSRARPQRHRAQFSARSSWRRNLSRDEPQSCSGTAPGSTSTRPISGTSSWTRCAPEDSFASKPSAEEILAAFRGWAVGRYNVALTRGEVLDARGGLVSERLRNLRRRGPLPRLEDAQPQASSR